MITSLSLCQQESFTICQAWLCCAAALMSAWLSQPFKFCLQKPWEECPDFTFWWCLHSTPRAERNVSLIVVLWPALLFTGCLYRELHQNLWHCCRMTRILLSLPDVSRPKCWSPESVKGTLVPSIEPLDCLSAVSTPPHYHSLNSILRRDEKSV